MGASIVRKIWRKCMREEAILECNSYVLMVVIAIISGLRESSILGIKSSDDIVLNYTQ